MKLVLNDDATSPKRHSQFHTITFNLKAPAKVRHSKMNGRSHLVVPCVMMTEGVHEGSEGPLLYTKEALATNTQLWNNKPIVVHHPRRNGANVSACDPDIIDRYGVGVLMNTRWEEGGLRTECWLEEAKTEQVDNRVLDALNSETVMEVSTGLLLDVEEEEGEWNGEKYRGIALNHRPDHLAILPDRIGACSIKDGAGLLRNAAEGDDPKSKLAAYHLALVNEMSASDLYNKITTKLREGNKDAWVLDVWDAFFIYSDQQSKEWYQKYTLDDDEVKFEGIRQSAEKEVRYKLSDGSYVGNVGQANKEIQMDEKERKALADKAIANAKSPWTEEDRDTLMKMSDKHLEWVGNAVEPKEEVDPTETPTEPTITKPKVEKNTTETPTEPAPAGNVEPTVEEYIENAPKGMQDMLRQGLAAHAQEKGVLVKKIMANVRNPFTKEQLEAKGVTELNGIAQLAEVPVVEPVAPAAHFGGQAPVAPTGAQEEEPLVAPTLNFGTDK